MAFMLIFLVPLGILAALAVVYDLRQRRRRAPAADIHSRVRAIRADQDGKGIIPGG